MRLRSRALRLTATLFLLFASLPLAAAISLSTTTPYTQTFDGIGTTAGATLPADWKTDRVGAARTVASFSAAGTVTTQAGGANLSTSASNGIYNFGSGTTTTGPDRAIGFLSSSGGTNSGNLYGQFVNNSGGNLAGLQISYAVEKYRNGSNAAGFRIQMFYSTDGVSWTNAGSNFATAFAADANNSGFATAPGVTTAVSNQTVNAFIASGSSFYLAWNYSVTSGSTVTNSQALAVDDIQILGIARPPATNPSGIGSADPAIVSASQSTTLTVTVTPGSNPASTGITVVGDLSSILGSAAQPFGGSGTTFTYVATIPADATTGVKTIPITIADAQGRSATTSITITIPHVVISQIYGGGGNTNATYTNDYVELYNPTANPIDTTGWSIQYGSATGTTWQSQPLAGIVRPNEYYLVKLAGGAVGSPLPTPNISGDINMSATVGKVALVRTGQPLLGACDGDPMLVDRVGFGTSPNCWEGASPAPAPSNTTAIFRKNGGATDTDNNGADFEAGAPQPRRTADVISEFGPWLSSTDPRNGGANAPRDGSITVDFSEAVTLEDGWYNIQCASSGLHNDATVAAVGTRSYLITPNVNFEFDEQCTVTITPSKVHDADTDDGAPNTDTLIGTFNSWSFTVVGAGALAPYAPAVHLTMGNPSHADALQPDNYLMSKTGYALSYNRDKGTPNWVSWHLEPAWFGNLTRFDTFRPDPAVPPAWYRVLTSDYNSSGFDRGHMCPNADRDNETRVPVNQETYLMTNIVPQAPDNNQGPWANLENYLRSLASAGNELYIVAGPAGVGGNGSSGFKISIAGGNVTVPSSTWKVAVILPKADGDDVSRVTPSTQTLAVIMPNRQGIRTTPNQPDDWKNFLTTIDAVEGLTGYDLLSNVLPAVQSEIQQGVYGDQRPAATITAPSSSAEGTAITATANVTDPDANESFTYNWTVTKNGAAYAAGTSAAVTFTPDDNGTYDIALVVRDHAGATDKRSQAIPVANVAPMITAISGPNVPLQAGGTATITVFFGDPGTADTHTAVFAWDDASTPTAVSCAAGACTASHSFAAAGVYGVTAAISDDDGGTTTATFNSVIVTDPNAGFVTGGGFVNGNGGKTSFAFHSAYVNGPKPQGNVEVQVLKNNFNFKALSMDWLVVAGDRAQFAGEGTVNGSGSYGYLLTAVDSDPDKFRIRIFDKSTGTTVYDNVPGAPDDIDSANPQPIGGGSIQIHR